MHEGTYGHNLGTDHYHWASSVESVLDVLLQVRVCMDCSQCIYYVLFCGWLTGRFIFVIQRALRIMKRLQTGCQILNELVSVHGTAELLYNRKFILFRLSHF